MDFSVVTLLDMSDESIKRVDFIIFILLFDYLDDVINMVAMGILGNSR